jgi:hypothetical protein
MNLIEMEQRLQRLEDLEAIRTLHREYLFYISNLEFDRALECFSEDIVTDVADYGVYKGKTAVSTFFKEVIYKNVRSSKHGHFTGQPVIEVDGDRGWGHWMFYRFLPRPMSERWVQGRYDCEYIREDGIWKFSKLKMKRPWPAFFKDL